MNRTLALLLVALTLAALVATTAPDAVFPVELTRPVARANPVATIARRVRHRYFQAARAVERLPPW